MSRTTITLTPEAESVIRRRMSERGVSFKVAVNDAIVESVSSATRRFETPVFDLGEPFVNLDKALRLAGDLEDDEIIRKMRLGK